MSRPGPVRYAPATRRGTVIATLAVVVAGVSAFHHTVPNSPGRLGSLVESFLPWTGLFVVLLLVVALVRRSGVALVALLLPVAVWVHGFGGLLLPAPDSAPGRRELLVVQHNVSDENPDPEGTARALASSGADLIALEELVVPALSTYEDVLGARYPHHTVHGTVGLWSKYPISEAQLADIRPQGIEEGWSRGLRAVVRTPYGEVAAYVAHLPSVRIGAGGLASARRDESARALGALVRGEKVRTVILMGDLNSTVEDRGLAPLTSQLNVAERGFALSFPTAFPVARIDQVLARSATVDHIRTLPATGSDHLPVAARVTLDATGR
ncbi:MULTISPECIES: endonuclease/exonuclease/phosphatase family protein [unclassified Streptomyces]|uniref:endonuclease/exonuclease/phosphatase family protein n=1 Tax=unclassified Streptomyces TaxID=2593676 RepID=UPI00082388F0|nr:MULTISPECIES: endonuclease/exonuclease/phosphatase family protein [unclassified Streptomyces]MYT97976.1 endonuclease/exonuclease/phosphatase family protein [Streptomyces sp. SID8350]SCK58729.1 vancomycin resistance protein VanJ [Streptomyces sp. AmelKG-D3]